MIKRDFSGNACRSRAEQLSSRFESPFIASQFYCQQPHTSATSERPARLLSLKQAVQCPHQGHLAHSTSEQGTQTAHQSDTSLLEYCMDLFTSLNPSQQLEVLSQLFIQVSNTPVPSDFLELASNAMCHLRESNWSNIIYLLANCLGTKRSGGFDSLLPVKRMPMGLID